MIYMDILDYHKVLKDRIDSQANFFLMTLKVGHMVGEWTGYHKH